MFAHILQVLATFFNLPTINLTLVLLVLRSHEEYDVCESLDIVTKVPVGCHDYTLGQSIISLYLESKKKQKCQKLINFTLRREIA